ncbi:MAG: L-serine ammonia-lyase, iron-sulfur-dependent, subunit alpha [Lachnospiraceae bacterium]|nr:L-serine ammonia-lyase, iron-sulfur-dependent, subunit alpha [Lachnospiraceae bacterium]MDD3796680.1 L-serine ammonia-lyase, iron-sulfur-dependent, subunit alpha [Lachnospiraceae bacterium]
MLNEKIYQNYLTILKEELVPAMGCTEPIALAYGAARAREVLGREPEKILIRCSGNIIKNVRCVVIPNSGGLVGIQAGVILGAVGGDASKNMEVLESVKDEERARAKQLLSAGICQVELLDSPVVLHFVIEMQAGEESVLLEIKYAHLNVTKIIRNGEILLDQDNQDQQTEEADRTLLNLEDIREFADTVELSEVRELIDAQISCNIAIAKEGMTGKYGLGIGRVIKESYSDDILTRMRSLTAAASEARMGGCDMPVIINSGSGNQGIACSVPLIIYAREMELPDYSLYRALIFSNLLTVYQKLYIGKLSAFCGAVSASCAVGAAITYMVGGDLNRIKNTIENTLANIPGIICDGAKISCAAKIAASLDAAYLAHHLAMNGQGYAPYTGILQEETSETISCVGLIGKEGMKETDKEILKIMIEH